MKEFYSVPEAEIYIFEIPNMMLTSNEPVQPEPTEQQENKPVTVDEEWTPNY